jgi:hypothetical protein
MEDRRGSGTRTRNCSRGRRGSFVGFSYGILSLYTVTRGSIFDTYPQDDCWLSGSEDAEVRRYAKDRGEMVGMVTSANAVPIRCVAIDPKGKRVAVASE